MTRWPAGWLLVAALLACASPPGAQAQGGRETLRIQDFPGAGNMLMRVARSKGFCEQAGLRCELKPINTAPLGLQAMLGGSLDVAVMGNAVLVQAVARGVKVKAVAGYAAYNVVQVAVRNGVVPAGQAYPKAFEALKGRRVGVAARGGGVEVMMNHLLRHAGMRPEDVTYVGIGSPQASFNALTHGQVDATVSWEPMGILCEHTKRCALLWNGAVAAEPADVAAMRGFSVMMVMRNETLEERPQLARALAQAARQAERFLADAANLDEVMRIYAEYDGAPAEGTEAPTRALIERMMRRGEFNAGLDRRAAEAALRYVAANEALPRVPQLQEVLWSQALQP